MYGLNFYVFNEQGIEMIAMFLYSTIDRMNGWFGIVISDAGHIRMTEICLSEGVAFNAMMNLYRSVLTEERQRREQCTTE